MARQAGAIVHRTKAVPAEALACAEALIADWDINSGMTYRQLARALLDIYQRFTELDHENV